MLAPRLWIVVAIVACLVAFASPRTASAGGVGVFDATGLHFGQALDSEGGTGTWLDQGGGLEVHLGTRGARVSGRLRLYYSAIIDLRGGVRHAGLFSGGVQVELLPDLEKKLGLYAVVDLGVSPLVTQLRIFMFADAGIGLRVRLNDVIALFGEATGQVRFDKRFSGGPLIFLGARFSID